jgi:glycosyltransferase involved in cell wall biosynthesis
MSNKKKLFIVNGAQFGYSSGHYFYCKYLRDIYSINYICFDRGLKRLELESVYVHYVSFNGIKLIRILRFLLETVKQSFYVKPHILFVTYFDICFLLPLFCRSKKTILDIRSGSLRKNWILRKLDNYFVLFQSFFFNRVIILSKSLHEKLHISRKKGTVVPLGSEVFFEGNHNFSTIDLLYVGSFDNRNLVKTIKGLYLFLQNKGNLTIKISYTIIGFGSSDESKKLLKSISEYKMVDFVKIEGRKNYEELAPYFKKFNIGVVFVPQKKWYDYQPATKLFEYMLSGMPVIATNTFENRLIINNNNGVIIEDTSEGFCIGLKSIYNQKNSFNSFQIRESVGSYTWENIVNKKLKPYLNQLIN